MSKLALLGGKPILKKPLPSYNSINKEEELAVAKVMKEKKLSDFVARAGEYFLGGKYVKELEKRFRNYFKVKYAVSFNSASTALQAAVGALGVGPGDQVITSPFTMSATASAILFNNALPVFADINENSFCLEAESIKKNITPKTKALLVVNLCGGTPDYDSILRIAQKNNLKIIEDNSQSPGAAYKGKCAGTIGDMGVFSFNFHKTIQCGEGGILVTNNKKYAFRAQLIRNHGEVVMDDLFNTGRIYEPILGNNFRLTELQAAIAIEQLKKLKKLNQQRIVLADYLTEKLKEFLWLVAPQVDKKSVHVYYVYPFRFLGKGIGIKRETFAKAMGAEGFYIHQGYQKPLYLIPIYQKKEIYPHSKFPFISKDYPQKVVYKKGICPVAERMYEKEYLSTAICQPPKTKKEIDLFVKAIEKIEENIEDLREYERKM
ncbi:DegT/DnrJ/EryC1/StrS family aminotransferase [Patescibacteria group bacterium]|nr:DegT/DnrJ/EryC1/StrS family aminotransferase [Patescibacteria group bacterium]MCG2699923.1 DegT/DnrJ/EryC1/StrS family aminotransferase [Candidatus Parcubacteria bacterium]